MGLFNFFKRKKNPLEETTEKLFNEIFPGGKKDIELGAKVLQNLLGNKIDFTKAVQIYTRSAALAKTTDNFDLERLRTHLAGYSLQYFSQQELNSYYEFLFAFRNSKSPIVVSNNSSDFYDKSFDALLKTGAFAYPYSSENMDEVCFIAFGDGTAWANENKQESQIAIYVYNWILYVAKKNTALYKHIISLMDDEKSYTEIEKIDFISSVLKNKSIEQLLNDKNAVNQVFIRIRAYKNLIDRLTEGILTFYTEHEDKIENYIVRANNDYPLTSKISQIIDLTIFDIDRISLRDMLSGQELK